MEIQSNSITCSSNTSKPCNMPPAYPSSSGLSLSNTPHGSKIALQPKTPYEMIHGTKPNLTGLPEWGSKVFVLKQDRGKLDSKTEEGYWVSYSEDSLGHCVYWANKRCVTMEHNITFDGKEVLVPGNMQNEEGS